MSNGWRQVKLSDVCEIQRGGSPRPISDYITDAEDGINWIKIGDVAEGAKYLYTTKEKIKPEGAKRSREVKSGDFLLSNSMSFGRPYILRTTGCIHDGWLVLRDKENQLNEDYLYHVLSSDFVYAQFKKFAVGAVVKNLNIEVVEKVEIPLPLIPEQIRIAAILDQAEALRRKRRVALAQLDNLTQAIFIEMFGDPVTNPKGWEKGDLGMYCDLFNGFAFKSSDYVEKSETLNCRMSNIRPSGEFDADYNPKYLPDLYAQTYKAYVLRDDDVIIAMTDMATEAKILGVPTVVNTKGKTFLLNQRVGKLLIKNSSALLFPFLKQLLAQSYVKQYYQRFAGGGLQINLGKVDLLSLSVMIPPVAIQREFAQRMAVVERLKETHKASLSELDNLFASLQHRAFRGEL